MLCCPAVLYISETIVIKRLVSVMPTVPPYEQVWNSQAITLGLERP